MLINTPSVESKLNVLRLEAMKCKSEEESARLAVLIAKSIQELDARAAELKAQEAELAANRKVLEGNVEELKSIILDICKNVTTIVDDAEDISITFRNSSACEILDEEMIPDEYMATKVTRFPDKKAIIRAIEAGVAVDGAKIIRKRNITIK